MKRLKIAMGIALAGLVVMAIGFLVASNKVGEEALKAMNIVTAGWAISMISYIFGGFLTAIKTAGKIAKWGWFLIPYFPMDIVIGGCAFIFAFFVLIYFPIVPIAIAYIQNKKSADQSS